MSSSEGDLAVSGGGRHGAARLRPRFLAPKPVGTVVGLWRPALASRIFGVLCTGVVLALGGQLVAHGARLSDRASGVLFLVVAPLAFWLVWGRPYLLLTEREVIVQNALAAFVIPIESIQTVKPGGYGLVIEVQGRARPVMAMAVLQANLSVMLHKRVRADDVSRQITQAAHSARVTET